MLAPATQPDRFRFLHIDLNSFFASVEQELHPEYRGKPLGVCGTMSDTGALIAASYEAKALGIYTLTKVGEFAAAREMAEAALPQVCVLLSCAHHTSFADHVLYVGPRKRIPRAGSTLLPPSHKQAFYRVTTT